MNSKNADPADHKETDQEVKKDVEEHIDKLAAGGGYIVSSSHDLHQLIPVENIYAMRDAVHEYNYSKGME